MPEIASLCYSSTPSLCHMDAYPKNTRNDLKNYATNSHSQPGEPIKKRIKTHFCRSFEKKTGKQIKIFDSTTEPHSINSCCLRRKKLLAVPMHVQSPGSTIHPGSPSGTHNHGCYCRNSCSRSRPHGSKFFILEKKVSSLYMCIYIYLIYYKMK